MKYEIKNRFTGAVQFTAEIECADSADRSIKIGLAVKWGIFNRADLSEANMREADLSGADLRGADLREADLSWADLREADLSGADLSGANLSGANLSEANMRGADLSGANLSKANLSGADLSEANMRGANMRGANLSGANLSGANLSEANMRGANLSEANMRGVPVVPNIHAAVYAAATARPELFDMSTFATDSGHTCGTAQCRAGWVLAVSGQAGLDLEAEIGTPAAAMAIYLASDPERWKVEKLPDFYCDNETALADMKRMDGVTE